MPQSEMDSVHSHYCSIVYQALLNSVKNSLNALKARTCHCQTANTKIGSEPFFEVDVQLSVPSVRLSPSLDDIQRAINRSATAVLGASKRMFLWKQGHLLDKDKRSYFDILGTDLAVVKIVLLLTGAMRGWINKIRCYLLVFTRYDWLWKDDKDLIYKRFAAKKPSISDFEGELQRFLLLEYEMLAIEPSVNIGALRLNTPSLKLQLCNESRIWKVLYSNNVHLLAREAMYAFFEYMRALTNKLNVEVESLDVLRYVMSVLKEVREKESSIELDVGPILDMYTMLELYLPGGVFDSEELEQKGSILAVWGKVVDHAEAVGLSLSAVQGTYKKRLIWDIRDFGMDVRSFRRDFEENGPMTISLRPAQAVEKMKKFKDELMIRERKMEMNKGGEELFALRSTPFHEITKTRKEINLIEQLYSLWSDVDASSTTWSSVLWCEMSDQVSGMLETVNGFDAKSKKLPRKLREWPAYGEVTTRISDLQILLPLLLELGKGSIKVRHWDEINSLLSVSGGVALPHTDETFTLQDIMKSGLLSIKDEVEEICEGADKQLQIERKMIDLKEQWSLALFEFSPWKNREVSVLKSFGKIIENLEEAQLQIQTLLSTRHVAPFKAEVQKFLTLLSDTSDTLELWIKVQLLWTSLESVFLGGDIAKQMPFEAKKFVKINKDWEKLMARAVECRLVVLCCSNEVLCTTLPVLYSELEKCQKSLEGYLEQKRSKFPRYVCTCSYVCVCVCVCLCACVSVIISLFVCAWKSVCH